MSSFSPCSRGSPYLTISRITALRFLSALREDRFDCFPGPELVKVGERPVDAGETAPKRRKPFPGELETFDDRLRANRRSPGPGRQKRVLADEFAATHGAQRATTCVLISPSDP